MGCSQSTPVEGAVESRQQPSHKTGSSSNVAQHLSSTYPDNAQESARAENANTATTTDPADVSHHSTGSALSLGSHKSGTSQRSVKSAGSGGGLGGGASSSSRGRFSSTGSNNDLSTGDLSTAESDLSSNDGGSGGSMRRNPKSMAHSSSVIGLDSMIESRREEGGLQTNIVHMEVPFGKPIEEVYDGVHSGPVLGSGISGMVRLVTHKATGVKYAVKCLDLGLVDTDEGLQQLREEIFIMCQLDHPNIVRLEEVYESHSEIYLVQELCLGGELFDRLDEQPDYHYTEAECARLIKQMLCAVRYLHSKGIIHRDLKLENFLFSSTGKDSELKMIDFGLSKHFRYGEVQHEAVGTPYTVAPEVIRGSYDERCDIWAIGVISFLLLSGDPPFGGCGGPEPLMTVRSNILKGAYEFEPQEIWELVSNGAKQFIEALLVIDPSKRPTASDAQKHAWLKEWANRNRTENDNVLNPDVVKSLVNFKEFSDMRKLLCEVLSFTLLPDQIKDLRKEFEKMDTDGSGEISLSALKKVLVSNAGAGSLGALTEEEVEDIFNAMRVKKTETRIHWHEFIAAGLSQCQVDDRNLRLAFDRLDSDHKGYVTLDDVRDLIGSDSLHSEEVMRKMWGDSIKAVNCKSTIITYDDFLLLMKGQTKEDSSSSKLNSSKVLLVVPEETAGFDEGFEHVNAEKTTTLPSGDVITNNGDILTPHVLTPTRKGVVGVPLTPIAASDYEGDIDAPLSMDDDEDIVQSSPFRQTSPLQHLTPPTSPVRRSTDYCSPTVANRNGGLEAMGALNVSDPQLNMPALLPSKPPVVYIRQRSRSMDEKDSGASIINDSGDDKPSCIKLVTPGRTVTAAPEKYESLANDKTKSALKVNREIYRAHRQMRLSVMEASKRFEEQQQRHAHEYLLKESQGNNAPQAGLVMRRGQNKQITSEAINKFLQQNETQQKALVEKANKRGGRGRRTRKKTISDMSGMIGSFSQDEMGPLSIAASSGSSDGTDVLGSLQTQQPQALAAGASSRSTTTASTAAGTATTASTSSSSAGGGGTTTAPSTTASSDLLQPTEMAHLRGATVPGEFRKVSDPFGAHGKYHTESYTL